MKETRIQEEVKFYGLVMQNMCGNSENTQLMALSFEKQKLIDWHNEQLVEPYNDDGPDNFNDGIKQYHKVFRKGGPLEWVNPVNNFDQLGAFGHGIIFDWVDEDNINPNYPFIQ